MKSKETNVTFRNVLVLGVSVLGVSALAILAAPLAMAQDKQAQYVQVAQIEIDPAQLDAYKAAVSEQIEAAIRLEPGVLVLYSVVDNESPTHVTVFEIYRDAEAYRAHLEAPHFKKYKIITEKMVTSLKLVKTDPIALGAK
jgi:quinol monooxygenase YgiN